MKLRNKRTGDVWEFDGISMAIGDSTKEKLGARGCSGACYARSLSELNEEWEDYTPPEPLIKDEKVRKAVRAWADAWGFDRVYAYEDDHTNTTRFENGNAGVGVEIDNTKIEPLNKRKCYTIAELFGEEEE